MGTFGIIVRIVVTILVIGLALDFLRLFGIRINDWLVFGPIIIGVAIYKWKTIVRTWDYLFAKYPIDAVGNADAGGKPPVYRSENAAERSRTLKEKLDADAAIAAATLRRERARAALADAENEVEEIARRSERRQ